MIRNEIGRCPECNKLIYIKDIEELDPETIIGCGLAEGDLVHCRDCPNKDDLGSCKASMKEDGFTFTRVKDIDNVEDL